MKIVWKEVFKFLAGAAFVGALTNLYLFANNISIPFLQYTLSPQFLGLRAVAGFVFFLIFFYYGFMKKK